MDTRKIAIEYRIGQWAQRLQERSGKGQSIQAFCEEAGVTRNTYFYWQRKVREAAWKEVAKVGNESLVPTGWAKLTAVDAQTHQRGVTIEVGGYRISATNETDMELLAKVCRALKALC